MKHKLLLLYSWLIRTLFFLFPDIPFIMRTRGFFYSLAMKKSGKNLQIASSSVLKGLENLSVGNNCFFAINTIISASTYITIEDEVMVGYASIIESGNHTLENSSYRFGPLKGNQSLFILEVGLEPTVQF
ncbi:acyltransferase [Providencia hangzhouensis]|uniref:acyltransferase n=1 Tax=Providencia hangzhouensis TaxID=3031799 RepID=UPI0034DD50D8